MVTAQKRDDGRMSGKEGASIRKQWDGGAALGVDRVSVQDDVIGSGEEGGKRVETLKAALSVPIVQVGEDA
jgi:hypothetical protein